MPADFAMIADQAGFVEADRQRDAESAPLRTHTAAELYAREIPMLPSERVLSDMLHGLSLDGLLELEGIMYVGCEAEEPGQFRAAVASFRERFHDHAATVKYLLGQASLHEYLCRGWALLQEEFKREDNRGEST
jgi:hypothetical protein